MIVYLGTRLVESGRRGFFWEDQVLRAGPRNVEAVTVI